MVVVSETAVVVVLVAVVVALELVCLFVCWLLNVPATG